MNLASIRGEIGSDERMNLKQQLHTEAMAAFAAAHQAAQAKPKPGTPEWELWQDLCRKAMNANDAYIRALNSGTAADPE